MARFAKVLGRVLAVFVLIVILLVALALLLLPLAGPKIANRKLPELLRAGASLGGLSFHAFGGAASIRDLRIDQPKGFGEGVLLSVPEAGLKVNLASLMKTTLTVEEFSLRDVEVNVVKDGAGRLNFSALGPECKPAAAPPPKRSAPRPVLVKRFEVSGLSFTYTDHAIGKEGAAPAEAGREPEPFVLRVKDFNLRLTGLLINPSAGSGGVPPAVADLTARIVQKPLPDALLGVFARLGPLGGKTPPVNAALRLFGLELGALGGVVPPGTSAALGGDALDLSGDWSMAPGLLDGMVKVDSSGGHEFTLPIGGTPDKPEFDHSSLLFAIGSRLGGGLGNLVGNVAGAGADVAAAAIASVATLGEGAGHAVGSVSTGLFDTVAGLATGDLSGAADGLEQATVGTVTDAADAVVGAGDQMVDGATQAVDTSTGAAAADRWRAEVKGRWAAAWAKARQWVKERPFPPVRAAGAGEPGSAHPENQSL